MTEASDKDTALSEFERSRKALETSYAAVPDAALRYLPPGDDYTLGGLAPHVTNVLVDYGSALSQMIAANFGEVHTSETNDEAKQRRDRQVAEGFGAEQRLAVFQEMAQAHEAVARTVKSLSAADFGRVAPVYFGDATEPYQTQAGDVLTWLIEHYDEHAVQVANLLADWRKTQSG